MVKSALLDEFRVKIIDKEIDGILGVELENKVSGFTIVLFCCYLPPENSVWGKDPTSFFSHLITQLYMQQQADLIFLCGDLNGPISNMNDVNAEVDDVHLKRHVIDKVKAGHGQEIIDFVRDSKLAIVNGRITPEKDNYTFVSSRGRSVVDYFITPHDCLRFCDEFRVDLMSELMLSHNLYHMISNVCRVPDHSMLTLKMHYTFSARNDRLSYDDQSQTTSKPNSRFYCFNDKPGAFLCSDMWKRAVQNIIYQLETVHESQALLDKVYDNLCKSIFEELDSSLGVKSATKKVRKRNKCCKPYWSDDLQLLWNDMLAAEKKFVKCKDKHTQKILRRSFKDKQLQFDRSLRKASRQYNRMVILELESACDDSPKKFWDTIKQLGPRKAKSIPMTVKVGDDLVSDKVEVCNKWKSDFEMLYNNVGSNCTFDDDLLASVLDHKANLEREMNVPGYVSNESLNHDIRVDEIEKVVVNLKKKKATGCDFIPNEVLKCHETRVLLCTLCNTCFKYSVIPSAWKRALIKPIPKGGKDPYLPLSYRGISLVSCVAKVYSAILNNRVVGYCNNLNLFADEQNGFRKGRLCEDHIFSLVSIIKNRRNHNMSTFCAYIDLEKAFDWIHRDMLLYKLLLYYDIDGRMYNAIKALLSGTYSSIMLSSSVQTDWFQTSFGVRQGA